MAQVKPLHLSMYCRKYSGLKNLFEIFIPIVDYWALYDNNLQTTLIADSNSVVNEKIFNEIQMSYVGKR